MTHQGRSNFKYYVLHRATVKIRNTLSCRDQILSLTACESVWYVCYQGSHIGHVTGHVTISDVTAHQITSPNCSLLCVCSCVLFVQCVQYTLYSVCVGLSYSLFILPISLNFNRENTVLPHWTSPLHQVMYWYKQYQYIVWILQFGYCSFTVL